MTQRAEVNGIFQAADEMQVDRRDLIWVSERPDTTLVREGNYPPLRGSFIQIGKDGLLFTRGSVPYYRTYPGLRVPQPLLLRPYSCDTPMPELASEILALTKMNWNSTQFDQSEYRKVIELLDGFEAQVKQLRERHTWLEEELLTRNKFGPSL